MVGRTVTLVVTKEGSRLLKLKGRSLLVLVPLEVLAADVLLLRGGEVPVVGLLAVVALLHRGLQLIRVVVQSVDSSLNMLGYSIIKTRGKFGKRCIRSNYKNDIKLEWNSIIL